METRYDDCPCPKTGCPRHGNCSECRKHHAGPTATHPVVCDMIEAEKKQENK